MKGGDEANDDGGAVSNVIEVTNAYGSDAVTINIRCSNGTKFAVQVSLESSVKSFKSELAQNCDIPPEKQLLNYKGRILKDDLTLKNYGLEAQHTVYIVGGFLPVASSNTENTVELETMGESGGSSHITLFDGFPEFEEVQRQFIQNPSLTPQRMYSLMNNRDGFLNTIRNSPPLTEVVNRDPYLSRIVYDPVIYRRRVADIIYSEFIIEMIRYVYRPAGRGLATHNSLNRLMQNPAISQMIQFLLSNPQNINRLFNPKLRAMAQNPGTISLLTSPERIQKSLFSKRGLQQCNRQIRDAGQMGVETARAPENTSGLGTRGSTTPNNNSNVGPEHLYARQLAQLQEMGFSDTRQNLEALKATAGNIAAAVDRLLGQ